MSWAVRSWNSFDWYKTRKAAMAAAEQCASEGGWAEVLRIKSFSLPPEVVATFPDAAEMDGGME